MLLVYLDDVDGHFYSNRPDTNITRNPMQKFVLTKLKQSECVA
jgi:hypothetical protein